MTKFLSNFGTMQIDLVQDVQKLVGASIFDSKYVKVSAHYCATIIDGPNKGVIVNGCDHFLAYANIQRHFNNSKL